MRVTATHLIHWSDQRVAQEILPVLVRRLISSTSQTTQLAMPGGDSISTPGWDGVVRIEKGNAWAPTGPSYWELGTSKDPLAKARSDYSKRLNALSAEERARATFVFVTSRRWQGKGAWQTEARSKHDWANVLVWDADDLEAWLEISAATSLWLGTQLGIAGHGIDSVENYWSHWQSQSKPAMTAAALFVGREKSKDELLKCFQQNETLIAVMADSQSEAIAFVCALLIESGYDQRAACLTSEEGWQFVDANTGIDLIVVTDNQLGSHRSPRDGQSFIVPLASGDQTFNLTGIGVRAADQRIIELRRPRPDEFEKSLLELGIASSDAARYTRTMGRSWTVFRRWHALNPAVKKPAWLDAPNASSLQILTLVGAWNEASDGDKACIAQIASRPYEDIENELLELAALDDAPVIKIGSIWKAKAPLEMLHLMASRLTGAILSRFFQVAQAVFEEPDPVLELEEDKRWMASIYGKVREHSGVALDAIADSIAKLGYFSGINESQSDIGSYVSNLVRQLLESADEARWLSVASYLRSFAEAAPDEFLIAIQQSLQSSDKPVLRLLTETRSSSAFGRCWHANLLWALELLSWYPRRLNQTANVLAELSGVEIKGNWANTPFNSLVSLFRPWYPQTAATVEQRLHVVRDLVNRHPRTGWQFLLAMVPRHPDMASSNAKPNWRDDDAGAGETVTHGEYRQFVLVIADLLLKKADGYAERIAELVPIIDRLDESFRDSVINLVATATQYNEEDKELIRSEVRKFLNWENSFNRDGEKHDRYSADALRPTFDALASDDLVICHAWIFSNGWIDLPDGHDEDYKAEDRARAKLRATAIREIYQDQGWGGIDRLAKRCGEPRLVGWELVSDPFDRNDLVSWLCEWYVNSQQPSFDSLTCGALHAVPQTECIEFLGECLDQLGQRATSSSPTVAGFMTNAPQGMNLWLLVEEQALGIRNHFWSIVRPSYVQSKTDELIFCLERLLTAERPRTAMEAIGDRAAELPSNLLVQTLKSIAAGQEPDAPLPQSWHISRVFKVLSESGELTQPDLASLEFAYYPALSHDKYGTPNLMAEILSSPDVFMEMICLAYKPHNSEREPLPENMQAAAETAGSLLHDARGIPGKKPDGAIDPDLFFSWIQKVREIAKEKDRLVVTDLNIGAWISDWPCKKDLESWPDPVIADLLDQDDCGDIRRGFHTGVYNARGVSSRMPYDGGDQERNIASTFRRFAIRWEETKPNLAAMIESLAKSYAREAQRHDDDGLWNQES